MKFIRAAIFFLSPQCGILIERMAPAFDATIVQAAHNFFTSAPGIRTAIIFFNYATVGALVLLTAYVAYKKRSANTLLLFLLTSAVGYLVSIAAKWFWVRPRPFVTLGFEPLVSVASYSLSFPSSHATVAFALATAMYMHNKKYGRVAVMLATLVALARVAVGVHYPTDVLAGALLGVITSYFTMKLWESWL